MTELKCEFCDLILKNKTTLSIHQRNAKRCIELQIKKNGVPVYTNKQTKVGRPPKNTKSENAEQPVETKPEVEDSSEEEIDEDAEIPLSSEEESSSSEEEEKYERVSQSKFNNLFKKKYTTIKTEIIKNDKPAEVHTKKIEDNNTLQTVEKKIVEDFSNNLKSDLKESIDIQMQHTNFQQSLSQLEMRTSFIEKKMDSMMSQSSDLKNSMNKLSSQISSILERLDDGKNEKRIRSLENKFERGNITVNDIERVIDDKLDDMFHLTKKMLAEVESKNELLDIFRDNMDDIVDKHYDLYKKFKFIKEDMEDMVYPRKK
jgi:uncharacterized coiled-coil protein SlyX